MAASGVEVPPPSAAPPLRDMDRLLLFRDVVEAAPYAMVVVRPDGRIGLVNAEAERVFGYQRGELIDCSLELLLPERLRHGHVALRNGFMQEPQSRSMGVGRDLFGRRKDGSEVPMEVGLRPVETPDGPGVLAAITDITVRKQAEAELRRVNGALALANAQIQQKVRELHRTTEEVESFVYIVSHDLRAPLVNLQSFSRELELSCSDLEAAVGRLSLPPDDIIALRAIVTKDFRDTLRFISASVDRFEGLINALLHLSRTGSQQLRGDTVDVAAVVRTTLDVLRQSIESSGAEIRIGDVPPACGDITALGQIFTNLIENALKYRDLVRPAVIEVGGDRSEGKSNYWVRDNGIGIPKQARSRLFQVFQRFHPDRAPGTGIGLAAVKRLVERQGGSIWADDADPVGSVFRFTLPGPRAGDHAC
jgi:PAS domain S-box-containing protein